MAPRRPRLYDALFSRHLSRYRQMAFVTGPRQVGKTTVCRSLAESYLSWDIPEDRKAINAGPAALAAILGLDRLRRGQRIVALDEIHRWTHWKGFLKGFFDAYEDRMRVIVTGSSRLDVYRRGGDSLVGRYFLFRMHPFSVAETVCHDPPVGIVRTPARVPEAEFRALWEHGGYPEPFLVRKRGFSLAWRRTRQHQVLREDVRDLTRLQDIGQLEALALLLAGRSASRIVLRNLASSLGIAINTAKAWIDTLVSLHHGFLVRPWSRRVIRSLVKEPKWYLRDWSGIEDPGARAETFVACHLLKAVEGWTDLGVGEFGLFYLRDKEQREVDFLVVRNGKPWFLIEAKKGDDALSPALAYFQAATGAKHAFQVAIDAPFEDADCFEHHRPVRVPARTLLSQFL